MPTTELIEAKTAIPPTRRGTVAREAVLARLLESAPLQLVSVAAPAGYGKSTLLSQWSEVDPRAFAWLTLDERDNDPVLLLRYVLAALERSGAVAAGASAASSPRLRAWTSLLPDVAAALSARDPPYVLVLDDVHLLAGASLDALGALVYSVPDGTQHVLSGRGGEPRIVARHRALGRLLELTTADLALTHAEAVALLDAAAAGVSDDEAVALHRRTEGWPAALYLAALAAQSSRVAPAAGTTLDRFVEDYLRAEYLASLPRDQLQFLARSSVLERLSPELCDAALERTDSRLMLDLIERSNLFLVPLDRERRWFRYHELFRAGLRRELDRIDGVAAAAVRLRASAWCEANGHPEDAMKYAVASGETDRAAELLVPLGFELYRNGRMAKVLRWLQRFDDDALLLRYPHVAVLGALVHSLDGHMFRAQRWLDLAQRGVETRGPADRDGVRGTLAAVRSMFCADGPEQMQQDAERALRVLEPHDPFRPVAVGLHAIALWLQRDDARAGAELERAAALADVAGATLIRIVVEGVRALLALGRGDVAGARSVIDGIGPTVSGRAFVDYTPMAILLAADAQTATREGDRELALRRLAAIQRLRPYLTGGVPVFGVLVLVEAATAYHALGHVAAARALLVDADDLLGRAPQLGMLAARVSALRDRIAVDDRGDERWASTLTAAELRLLPLLTTHLTFREIGDRLFVSRNTVKTQAISIYRKLGAGSRAEAVQRATELGLLEPILADLARATLPV